jgi:hypothetical protein
MTARSSPPTALLADMNNGIGCILGAFMCVMTSTTPGELAASAVSSVAMRPFGTVLYASAA